MLYYLWIGDFQGKTNLHEKQGVPSLDVVVAQGQLLPMPVLIQWPPLELELVVIQSLAGCCLNQDPQFSKRVRLQIGLKG